MQSQKVQQQKVPQNQYTRMLSYLGDVKGPGTIRVILPYMLINNSNRGVLANYDFITPTDQDYFDSTPVVQFQRSATKDQLGVIISVKKQLEKSGGKLFYDIDDLITNIPEYNHASHYYQIHNDSIKKMLSAVDCIVCSTHELERHMSQYNKTVVIENRLVRGLWNQDNQIERKKNEKLRILWAGSTNHFSQNGDKVGDFSKPVIDYINTSTDKFDWIFVGGVPPELRNNKDISVFNWCHQYMDYPKLLQSLNPDIGIALLKDNDFNRCKSNIKALEFVALGIPGIYSRIRPYSKMSIKIEKPKDFIQQIEKLSSNPGYYQHMLKKDCEALAGQIYWDDMYINEYLKKYFDLRI